MVSVDVLPHLWIVETEYISLAEAATIAGYVSTSTLQAAARARPQRLKTVWPDPPYLMTRVWLQEYLDGVKASKSQRGSGRPERVVESA